MGQGIEIQQGDDEKTSAQRAVNLTTIDYVTEDNWNSFVNATSGAIGLGIDSSWLHGLDTQPDFDASTYTWMIETGNVAN